MMLPNESLLEVLHFADYRTLVLAKFAGRRFLCPVMKFAEKLARHRRYVIDFYTAYIAYNDVTIAEGGSVQYELGNQSSLADACRKLHEVIGTSAVGVLTFYGNAWDMPGVGVVFDIAPALKCAEDVVLHSQRSPKIAGSSDAFMSNFAGIKSLSLWLDCDTFRQFKWKSLRQEAARGLRCVVVFARPSGWTKAATKRSVEELVRNCTTVPLPLGGGMLELDFSDVCFPRSFGRRIIELLKDSVREVTFRMSLWGWSGTLIVNERDYTVDVDGATTRYTSKKSRIVVEVEDDSIAIHSTAEAPPKNIGA